MSADHEAFAALHTARDPLILVNIWDAGSAKAVARAGAKAIATGSLSLAGALGFEDGEAIAFDVLLEQIRRIAAATDLPLSVDIETGYATDLEQLKANGSALVHAGAVGCNIEDRIIGSTELRDEAEQAERIAVLADAGLFVNARTDLFLAPLMAGENPNQPELVEAATARCAAYASGGAQCFFVPGLSDPDLIASLCKAVSLPVNVMRLPDMVGNADLRDLGVARISYGPAPWQETMAEVEVRARDTFASLREQ